MLVYPDIPPGWKNVDRWPSSKARDEAFEVFKRLNTINPIDIQARLDVEDGWRSYLQFEPAAQERFDEWRSNLNRAIRGGEFEHPAIEAHFTKYNSLMPSLALVFHLIDVAGGKAAGPVSHSAAELAAAWCEFLGEHAKRVYGLGTMAAAIRAKTLARHIQHGNLPNPFTKRDIYHKGWTSAKDTEEPLDLLEALRWLRSTESRTGGRPTVLYHINPATVRAGR
jgi:hypothetical protein